MNKQTIFPEAIMDEDKLVRKIEKIITKYRKKPKTYMDTIILSLKV